jgi:hypothetical protein
MEWKDIQPQFDLFMRMIIEEIGEEKYSEIVKEVTGQDALMDGGPAACAWKPYCGMACHTFGVLCPYNSPPGCMT